MPARVDTPPVATGDNAINLVKLRERLLKVGQLHGLVCPESTYAPAGLHCAGPLAPAPV